MSDKEAKLAAARKRAEAIKAKQAEKKSQPVSNDAGATAKEESTETDPSIAAGEPEDTPLEAEKPDDTSAELERVKLSLEENNKERDSLRKKLIEQEEKYRELEKSKKSQVADLEASLARRDEQVHTFELEMSRSKKEIETQATTIKELREAQKKYDIELSELQKKNEDTVVTGFKELQEELANLRNAKTELEADSSEKDAELKQVSQDRDALQKVVKEFESKQSITRGENQSRTQELQSKTDTLQTENQSLLAQLSELQNHLISIQDEKFALAETVERLQRQLKDAKAFKTPYAPSREHSRPRASREFDRTVGSLEEVPLSEPVKRNPKEPPAELQNNIVIDLTSWYDRHAGEVIEV